MKIGIDLLGRYLYNINIRYRKTERVKTMTEYTFEELGYFTKTEAEAIKEVMDGKTYMQFEIAYCNNAGNYIMTVRTHEEDVTKEELKNFFIGCVFSELRYHQLFNK